MSDVLTPSQVGEKRVSTRNRDPIASLRSDVNRMMDSLWRGSPMTGVDWPQSGSAGWAAPAAEFIESETQYMISAELPGLNKSDIEISLQDNMLVISGEKHSDTNEVQDNVLLNERRFGHFQRAFTLPADVDSSKIEAQCENGLLRIILPRSEEKRAVHKIKVK